VVTDNGPYDAELGTVTVMEVVVDADTVALTAPKYTTLLDATALKFVPLITTLVPATPATGENELIVGCEKREGANIKKVRKV
jgi:hypothetical protein